MPVNFQYLDPQTRAPQFLDEVDRAMCEAQGIAYSDEIYCNLFLVLQFTATSPRVLTNGMVDRDKLIAYLTEQGWSKPDQDWAIKFTCDQYLFSTWSSR